MFKTIPAASVLGLFFFSLISCDEEIGGIGVELLNSKGFANDSIITEVHFKNNNISSIDFSNTRGYLFGSFQDNAFGHINASFVSQLALPSLLRYTEKSYDSDTIVSPEIDAVYLKIPYHATQISDSEATLPLFELDSVFGNTTQGFDFSVEELGVFLNNLDPAQPNRTLVYPSNYNYESVPFEKTLATFNQFIPNANDTVFYVERKTRDAFVYDIDTIKLINSGPFMMLPLDKNYLKEKILNILPGASSTTPTELSSNNDFIRYFKGLMLKVQSNTDASSMIFDHSNATLEMFYTNTVVKSSTNEELDTIKKSIVFPLSGVQATKIEHDYNATLDADKLYVQGTAGYSPELHLLDYDEANPDLISETLNNLKGKQWLINEANLRFYVDESYQQQMRDTVFRLYIYKELADSDQKLEDYLTSSTSLQGKLQKDVDDRYYYNFRLTDYITELIKEDNFDNVAKLRLKVYEATDAATGASDTSVRSQNINPRGVVLHGGQQDVLDLNRPLLKIYYTKKI